MEEPHSVISEAERKRRRHRNERIAAAILILLAGAVALLLVRLNRSMEERLGEDQRYIPKQTPFTRELDWLQQYIRIDTSNPPGKEIEGARFLQGILRGHGIEAEIIEPKPGRASLYARIDGSGDEHGLMLLHHIDVVPADPAGWTRPPFSGEIHLDQMYGRGALDMKGPGIAFLRAFIDVAQRREKPRHDIVYLAVADEETGSEWGMRWLLQHRPDIFQGVEYALNEGGITEMIEERVTYYGVEIGAKTMSMVVLAAAQKEALRQARKALEPWMVSMMYEPHRILPEVAAFFRDLAPQKLEYRDELQDIERTVALGKFYSLPAGYRDSTQNGVWAEGPQPAGDHFELTVYLLNLPDEKPQDRISWLRKIVEPHGARVQRVLREEGPYPIASRDTELYRLIERIAGPSFRAPVGTEFLNRSTSDSRFLRRKGIQAYGINPFAVDFFQSESIHKVDERIRADYFNEGVEFTRKLVLAYAFGESGGSTPAPTEGPQ